MCNGADMTLANLTEVATDHDEMLKAFALVTRGVNKYLVFGKNAIEPVTSSASQNTQQMDNRTLCDMT